MREKQLPLLNIEENFRVETEGKLIVKLIVKTLLDPIHKISTQI